MKTWAWLAVIGLATALGVAGVWLWRAPGLGASPSGGGSVDILIAVGLAVAGACGLAVGLMQLAFFSARRGYDDRADSGPEADGD